MGGLTIRKMMVLIKLTYKCDRIQVNMPPGVLPVELEKLTVSSFGGTSSKNLPESPKKRKGCVGEAGLTRYEITLKP